MIVAIVYLLIVVGLGFGLHYNHQPEMSSFYVFMMVFFGFLAGASLNEWFNKKERQAEARELEEFQAQNSRPPRSR